MDTVVLIEPKGPWERRFSSDEPQPLFADVLEAARESHPSKSAKVR